jgi:3-(methylthio)propanoyl-CoA dehydrogenase
LTSSVPTKLAGFEHADTETIVGLLDEFGRMISDVWSPTNETGDREGLTVDTTTSTITTPTGFRDAYQAYAQAGWAGAALDSEYGGGGFPHLTGVAMGELLSSANMALAKRKPSSAS